MTIVRNKFEVDLTQSFNSAAPATFQSLVAFILKRRSSDTHFEMVHEPLSLAA